MKKSPEKLNKIQDWFQTNPKQVFIAFSGGVDSCLTLFLARKFLGKEKVIAVVSASPSLKKRDLETAINFCKENDINLEIIKTKEIEDPSYFTNPVNRCYFCKSSLYDELKMIAEKFPGSSILNGQNKDDLSDYRPGIKAANEFNVLTPLADCGFTKNDVRQIAKYFNLATWNKPANPCLSSRIPYGQEVTIEKLEQIESAENFLNDLGFLEVRVRHFNNVAKIEVPLERLDDLIKFENELRIKFQQLGFFNCEIDNEGFISGKLNRVLA
jgi:pyridinium-3,5-biscarboxylic acid mononucleotide sulfurtransferase